MRKLRSTPVVRSKEPMPAETRMEIIELVQTNVDKVSTIIAVFLSSLHTILAPVSSNRDPLRLTSSFLFCDVCTLCALFRSCLRVSFLENGNNVHVALKKVLIENSVKHGTCASVKVLVSM